MFFTCQCENYKFIELSFLYFSTLKSLLTNFKHLLRPHDIYLQDGMKNHKFCGMGFFCSLKSQPASFRHLLEHYNMILQVGDKNHKFYGTWFFFLCFKKCTKQLQETFGPQIMFLYADAKTISFVELFFHIFFYFKNPTNQF